MNNKLDQSEINVLPVAGLVIPTKPEVFPLDQSVSESLPGADLLIPAAPEASLDLPSEAHTSVAETYQPYPWQPANRLLAFIDTKTGGKAGQIQRIVSYLFFGGLASVVNLLIFALFI